jgi:hypothetical protein
VAPWSGHPAQPPALAAVASVGAHAGATAYASWNGATEVASWQVLVGSSSSALKPAGSAAKTGFETSIPLSAAATGQYVAVQALASTGAVLGTSRTIKG